MPKLHIWTTISSVEIINHSASQDLGDNFDHTKNAKAVFEFLYSNLPGDTFDEFVRLLNDFSPRMNISIETFEEYCEKMKFKLFAKTPK